METTETIIRPPGKLSLSFKELWNYRELFYFFTWRDIKVKYKQTILGIIWAVLQPLALMVIFTFVFSRTLKLGSGNISYPIFSLAGIIIWNFFYGSVSNAGESMIQNAAIIKKIYFPRLIIPCSAILAALFDLVFSFTIFLIFCLAYHQKISSTAFFYFPAAILLAVLAAFGAGTFFAALNIKYRDFRYALPFFLQFLFFASQVVYPVHSVRESWLRNILALNPVNAAIELMRAPLEQLPPDPAIVLTGVSSSLLLILTGAFYFRKTESYFADIA